MAFQATLMIVPPTSRSKNGYRKIVRATLQRWSHAVDIWAKLLYFNAFPFLVLAIPGYKIKIVGCFKEKTKAPHIPERLFSDATGFNSKTKIDYKNFGQYILGAIRRCASAAKAKKYDFFALRKVGECKAVNVQKWSSTFFCETRRNAVDIDNKDQL